MEHVTEAPPPIQTVNTEPTWKYETDDDKDLGIETQRYENGQIMKRVKLSDGRYAVARRLKGRDANSVRRITAGDEGKYSEAIAVQCIKIDDKALVIEDLADMWMDDYQSIMSIATINFPITRTA